MQLASADELHAAIIYPFGKDNSSFPAKCHLRLEDYEKRAAATVRVRVRRAIVVRIAIVVGIAEVRRGGHCY